MKVVLVVYRVLVVLVLVVWSLGPFHSVSGLWPWPSSSSMQLQGFCPPIIYQDDTGDEDCWDSDDSSNHHEGLNG